jgi:hypothetical protein
MSFTLTAFFNIPQREFVNHLESCKKYGKNKPRKYSTRLLKIFQHTEKRNKHSAMKYLNLELIKPPVNMFSTFVIIVTIIFMKWRILRVYSTDRVN